MTVYNKRSPTIYVFKRGRWVEYPAPDRLRMFMKNNFADMIYAYIYQIRKDIKASNDKIEKEKLGIMEDNYLEIYKRLKTTAFKSKMITEVCDNFARDDVNKFMDMDPQILGVKNGVLVATEDGIEFRPGIPEDFVSASTNAAYMESYTDKNRNVKAVRKWIRQLFCDSEMEHYFLKCLSSVLIGGNIDKKLFVRS